MGRIIRQSESSEEELTPYEKIRKKNVDERDAIFDDIFKPKANPSFQVKNKTKSIKAKNVGLKVSKIRKYSSKSKNVVEKSKKRNEQRMAERVLRGRKKDDDEEYVPPTRLRAAKKTGQLDYAENTESEESSDDERKSFKRRRHLPRRETVRAARKTYLEENVFEPPMDEFMWCDYCEEDCHFGCTIPEHRPQFVDEIDMRGMFLIAKSKYKEAGLGVFNGFEETIPEGIVFGPYYGPIIDPVVYKSRKKQSGYAWELKDPMLSKVVGYVDPGWDGEVQPYEYPLAMINSANCSDDQNVVGVQYRGEIVYRVCRPIEFGEELLTYYGHSYSRSIGILPNLFKIGEQSYSCRWPSCNKIYTSRDSLQNHERVHRPQRHKCKQCPFQTVYACILTRHILARHSTKKFECPTCHLKFTMGTNLQSHVKRAHPEIKYVS